MRRQAVVWRLALILALLLPGSIVLATPTPPYVIVNYSTKECAESILGDDCSWCDPPPGWEVLGPSAGTQCPEGYTLIERIDMQCRRYKNEFCCSGFQHRGDCEDMVVHDADGLCAFVEDIQNCALPTGWKPRPPDVDPSRWQCPHDYRWADPVACLALALIDEPTAITPPTMTTELTTTAEPTSTTTLPGADVRLPTNTVLITVCLASLFIAVVAVGIALVWVVSRQRRP
jgi:hypothetical protein